MVSMVELSPDISLQGRRSSCEIAVLTKEVDSDGGEFFWLFSNVLFSFSFEFLQVQQAG